MVQKLKYSHQVWKLAQDLGLKPIDNPISDILSFCERKIKKYMKEVGDCKTLSELLDWVAAKAGTKFEIINTDEDLEKIKYKYLEKGEKIFVRLEEEFSDEVYGITYKLNNRNSWEDPYVSVIDCRGNKTFRRYYTKWHEVAHLLVLTDQMRLAFRRSHCMEDGNNPEEAVIDIIAGHFGFYSPLILEHAKEEISFESIENLRLQLCPEASQLASIINFSKAWPSPCLLVNAEVAFKRGEIDQLKQGAFEFMETPKPVLRATQISANEGARKHGLLIFKNMRVPESSVIYRLYYKDGIDSGEGDEILSSWKTSDGKHLPDIPIKVKAKRFADSVQAIIIPTKIG